MINPEIARRDWFAGQALLGLLLRHSGEMHDSTCSSFDPVLSLADREVEGVCVKAYKIANTMVDVGEKTAALGECVWEEE